MHFLKKRTSKILITSMFLFFEGFQCRGAHIFFVVFYEIFLHFNAENYNKI